MNFICNQAAIDLIKKFESLHDGDLSSICLQPKMCPAGIWTVGYGHALRDGNGQFLAGESCRAAAYRQYAVLEESGAKALLRQDVQTFSKYVSDMLGNIPSANQFGAMVSLCYNIGTGAFMNSTVLRQFNAGNAAAAADAFLLWNKGTVRGKKVILPGLVKRRLAEKALFLTINKE